MNVDHTNEFKRDGLHETPLASHYCEAERAPSLRELRAANRLKRVDEVQASHDKVITAPQASEQEPNRDIDVEANRDVSPRPKVHVSQHCKTITPADQQDQPHSGLDEFSRAQPPSLEGGLNTEFCSNHHATRETNLSNLKREQNKPIKFPSPRDTIWKEVNSELELAIPLVFTKTKMNTKSVSQLSESFINWIYAFFCEKFGVKDTTPEKARVFRKPRIHRGLERLRKQKKELQAKKITFEGRTRQEFESNAGPESDLAEGYEAAQPPPGCSQAEVETKS